MGRIKEFTRIKNSKQFDAVYRRADKTWHTPWFVLFYKQSSDRRVGFVASKKLGNAVHRNRAKRLLRAQFIHQIDNITTGEYILVAKPPILLADHKELSKAYQKVLKSCKVMISNFN